MATFRLAGWQAVGAGRGMRASHSGTDDSRYFQGDLCSRIFVERVLNEIRPQRVLFLAGPSSVQASFANPVDDFSAQTIPLIQVLDGIRKMADPPGVLLVSSAAVYGNPVALPLAEDSPSLPISPYGFHKLQQEALLDEYRALYGLATCKARVFSTYGVGLRQLAVWDIAARALKGDFSLHGSGVESRDYLHVSDVAAAFETICRIAPFSGEVLNVASGLEVTIGHLASLIYGAIGVESNPRFEGAIEVGKPARWRADVGRLAALGFVPKVDLADGVEDTVKWIRNNV